MALGHTHRTPPKMGWKVTAPLKMPPDNKKEKTALTRKQGWSEAVKGGTTLMVQGDVRAKQREPMADKAKKCGGPKGGERWPVVRARCCAASSVRKARR